MGNNQGQGPTGNQFHLRTVPLSVTSVDQSKERVASRCPCENTCCSSAKPKAGSGAGTGHWLGTRLQLHTGGAGLHWCWHTSAGLTPLLAHKLTPGHQSKSNPNRSLEIVFDLLVKGPRQVDGSSPVPRVTDNCSGGQSVDLTWPVKQSD